MFRVYSICPKFYSAIISRSFLHIKAPLNQLAEKQAISDIHPPTDAETKTYPVHINDLVDRIATLTLLEVADLNELLRKRLNIQNTPMMMPQFAQSPGQVTTTDDQQEAVSNTKSSFSVRLLKFDTAKKVALIKEIKQILPELNLVQAKKFVESIPGTVKADIAQDEADAIKKSLEAVGGTIEIE